MQSENGDADSLSVSVQRQDLAMDGPAKQDPVVVVIAPDVLSGAHKVFMDQLPFFNIAKNIAKIGDQSGLFNFAKFGNTIVGRNESVTLRESISKIAISNYHKSSKWVSQSDSQEEAALVEFVANIGINLSFDSCPLGNNNLSENCLQNFDDNSTQSIEVALIIPPNIQANRDTCIVIFKNKLKDTVEVIVRGDYESMKKIVKSDAQTGKFEAAYTYNVKQGLSTHVYASRTISKELLHKWVT